MIRLIVLLSGFSLAACSVSVPVAVITSSGDVLHGVNNASLSTGEFDVSGNVRGKPITCHGSYDPSAHGPTISVTTTCSDGRKGIGRAVRDSLTSGSGKIQMNDGTEALFVYGAAAGGI